jgi:dolichol kinase
LAVAHLGPKEFRRRVWHFAPGVLALAGTAIPYSEPVPLYLVISLMSIGIGLILGALRWSRSIRRPGERNCLQSILGYGVSVLPLLVFFPSQVELALTVTAILAFGDGTATLVGLLAGRKTLPWNRCKTWEGAIAFVVAALPTAIAIYWGIALPRVSFETAAMCVIPTVIVAAVVETVPARLNDNVFVGASAAAMIIAMHGLIVGWS